MVSEACIIYRLLFECGSVGRPSALGNIQSSDSVTAENGGRCNVSLIIGGSGGYAMSRFQRQT
jgi:hypothetical protein